MSNVVYVGTHDALEIPAARVIAVRDGDPVEVSDELAKELVKRGDFKSADKPRSVKSAKEE